MSRPVAIDQLIAGLVAGSVGADLAVTAPSSTVAPTSMIHTMSGTGNLRTITPPSTFAQGSQGGFFIGIPSAAFTWDSNDNIDAGGIGRAVVGTPLLWIYNQASGKWSVLATGTFNGGRIDFPGEGAISANGGHLTLYSQSGASWLYLDQQFLYAAIGQNFAQFGFFPGNFTKSGYFGSAVGLPVELGIPDVPWMKEYVGRRYACGSTLVPDNFVLSSTWGSTASVSVNRGDDDGYEIVVTCGGSGIGANPTINLYYQDGTWTTAPLVIAKLADASNSADLTLPVKESSTATQQTLTLVGTPTIGRTYTFKVITVGTRTQTGNPPPVALQTTPQNAKKVIPLGDSITLGTPSGSGGYRTFLDARAADYGITIDFEGLLSDGPPALRDKSHSGVSGSSIAQTTSNLGSRITDINADQVLLCIGANDAGQGYVGALTDMAALLDALIALMPTAQIVVATLTPRDPGTDAAYVVPFNSGLATLVSSRASRCVLVDMHGVMNYATDIADTLHPNATGYYKMSIVFWNALLR